MVFSDPVFLLGFLPLALAAYHLSRRFSGGETAVSVLIAASAIFYAWWSIPFLALLVGQCLGNHLVARQIERTGSRAFVWLARIMHQA